MTFAKFTLSFCAPFLICTAIFAAPKTTYKLVFHFNGTDGANANALIQGFDGNLYGTTHSGGTNDNGTVFKITPAGTLTTLYNFCSNHCLDGSNPAAGLLLATDGNFYGTTREGGANDYGEVFKITPEGAMIILYSFCSAIECADGSFPQTPLLQGIDGNFYGTTSQGGAHQRGGTIFRITPKGKIKTLHSFCSEANCGDGAVPRAFLQASDGNFYGVAGGGASGNGTAFRMTPTGTVTTLHTFCASTCGDGSTPQGIILGSDGNFYGITEIGGANNATGTAFKLTAGGGFTVLHDFCTQPGCLDGAQPTSGVIEGNDGNFYGTAPDGGTYGRGTVYTMTPPGTLTPLHSFNGTYAGSFPEVPLVQATSGIFYGTTSQGGKGASIFSLSLALEPFVEAVQSFAKAGTTVMILGQGFKGVTAVSFNGVTTSHTVVSDTYLTARVPIGATSGFITVTTSDGVILKSNKPFIVMP